MTTVHANGMAFRFPASDVSVFDLTVELENEASYENICNAMKEASEGAMKGVLAYIEQSGFDRFSWYDNEWGCSCKVVEMPRVIAS